MNKYTPLTLAMIDEGRFLQDADADLVKIQQALLEYRDAHKGECEGVKAELTIKITIACTNAVEGLFSVRAVPKLTMPNRPETVNARLDRPEGAKETP
jgi:hypothetical protein